MAYRFFEIGLALRKKNETPKVSICVITYNHVDYIDQCLQSIIDQETDFNFEIIIGDDASTDGTQAVVQKFAEKFPDIVKPIFHEKHVGGTSNYLSVHEAAIGDYIAHLDGDDYVLPGKLSTQVKILDENLDIAMAVHAVQIVKNKNPTSQIFGADSHFPMKGTVNDLLRLGTYFSNSSVMVRKVNRFEHARTEDIVDYLFHIEQASRGYIFLDRRVFGCYRLHEHGVTKDPQMRSIIEKCYETAFSRAMELGVSYEEVQSGRLRKRMRFAIERYIAGDIQGYLEKIKINKDEFKHATSKHVILHYLRPFPHLIGLYFWIRRLG